MDYRDRIVLEIAERESERLCREIIHILKQMTEGMQSSDDSPLESVWDEVCVQVQSQESATWEFYLETIRDILADEVEKLAGPEKQSIWLQADEGIRWGRV